ncbi:MAG TPA: class I SAM-dependent methyltransferase [Bacteroidota bacterium]|jgi:ubiquinone/menaquinone biosynthesis C-methylase UbiE
MVESKFSSRQEREGGFYDSYIQGSSSIPFDHTTAFSPVATDNQWMFEYIQPLTGKRVLDIGVGTGEQSLFFASKGAEVHGIEVSKGLVDFADAKAIELGLKGHCFFYQRPIERSEFPDEFFDLVVAREVLHHVELEKALPEILRILKPGGKFVSRDPLRSNIFVNAYRWVARSTRSQDETPLSKKEIDFVCKHFKASQVRTFYLTSLIPFFFEYVRMRLSSFRQKKKPEWYWMKAVEKGIAFPRLFKVLQRIDGSILSLPGFDQLAWVVVIRAEKEAG